MADVRLEITDGLGRRVVRVDTPVFTIGRRSKSDLCLAGTDVSRDHAQIASDGGRFILRDQQSRYGTFVNDQPVVEKPLAHGDRIRLGRGAGAELLFLVDEAGPATPSGISRAANSSVENLRQMAALLEGLRALGSGYVLDEVLTLVLDAAIEVTGAERGFIMLANPEAVLQFTLARARGRVTLPGKTWDTSLKIPERVFTTGETQIVSDLRRRRPGVRPPRHRRAGHQARPVCAAAAGALSARVGRRARTATDRRALSG